MVRAVCLSILLWSNVDYDIELWWSEYIPMINYTSFIYSFSLLDFISTSSVRLTLLATYYSMIFCFKNNIERERFSSSKTKINDFHIDPFDACVFYIPNFICCCIHSKILSLEHNWCNLTNASLKCHIKIICTFEIIVSMLTRCFFKLYSFLKVL